MHHPPIAAVYADSPHWDYWVDFWVINLTSGRTKRENKVHRDIIRCKSFGDLVFEIASLRRAGRGLHLEKDKSSRRRDSQRITRCGQVNTPVNTV